MQKKLPLLLFVLLISVYAKSQQFTSRNNLPIGASQRRQHRVTTVGSITGLTTICSTDTTVLSDSTAGGIWTSSDTAIAAIDSFSGTLRAVSSGTTIITYTVTSGIATTTVTIHPTPTLSSSPNPPAICSGTPFVYVPASATTGTTFMWSRAVVMGLGNPYGVGTGTINEILVNNTNVFVYAYYIYTLSTGFCTNLAHVSVMVKPVPYLSTTFYPTPICDSSIFSYSPASAVSGTSFAWTRGTIPGLVNPAASGTGNPNEQLITNVTATVPVTYVYTLSADGCSNMQNVAVNVNPCWATGINTIAEDEMVDVYPNPSKGDFTIQVANANHNPATIEIYNITGSKVLTTQTTNSEISISNNTLAPGMYICKIAVGDRVVMRKVVVE